MFTPTHLQLYANIRRLHKRLPPALRFMGNKYVRDEWARHRPLLTNSTGTLSPTDAATRDRFVAEWARYHDTLRIQILQADRWEPTTFGQSITPELLDAMSDQQIGESPPQCQPMPTTN
ncbi:hypothetical protein HK100_003544 [Physocladia obscura]|uniref:Succinate dehydrogenase assembly factor 3 n=1 Tax=Physocladia obscura TaxID=109957 RepID=A0AAD5TAI5_9FUNG|nr:hypothetical protein HK100_003544 [Physocladia obscura]